MLVRYSQIPTLVTVSAAAVLGLAAGASLTVAIGTDLSAMISGDVLASSVMTALALFTIRRWLSGYDARSRAALTSVAEQQRALEEQRAAHETAVQERAAAAVTRESTATQDQLRAMSERVDALAEGRTADRQELETLRQTNRELLDEYNALVRETLQSGAAQFVRKDCHQVAGPRLVAASEVVPEPRGEYQPADAPPVPAPH